MPTDPQARLVELITKWRKYAELQMAVRRTPDLPISVLYECEKLAKLATEHADELEALLREGAAPPDYNPIQHAVAHWFMQGGQAQFGPLGSVENADELIAAILSVVRAGAAPPPSAITATSVTSGGEGYDQWLAMKRAANESPCGPGAAPPQERPEDTEG